MASWTIPTSGTMVTYGASGAVGHCQYGNNIYVARMSTIDRYSRAQDSSLTFVESYQYTVSRISISNDGLFMYGVSAARSKLSVFAIDTLGKLSLVVEDSVVNPVSVYATKDRSVLYVGTSSSVVTYGVDAVGNITVGTVDAVAHQVSYVAPDSSEKFLLVAGATAIYTMTKILGVWTEINTYPVQIAPTDIFVRGNSVFISDGSTSVKSTVCTAGGVIKSIGLLGVPVATRSVTISDSGVQLISTDTSNNSISTVALSIFGSEIGVTKSSTLLAKVRRKGVCGSLGGSFDIAMSPKFYA